MLPTGVKGVFTVCPSAPRRINAAMSCILSGLEIGGK